MADRSHDWFAQAERDLETAEELAASGKHEWACFAAHQSAEKAIKSVHLRAGQEAWGHALVHLIRLLPEGSPAPPDLVDRAKVLDNYYIPTRYPNGHSEGAPFEFFGPLQSKDALEHARAIVAFARAALAAA